MKIGICNFCGVSSSLNDENICLDCEDELNDPNSEDLGCKFWPNCDNHALGEHIHDYLED